MGLLAEHYFPNMELLTQYTQAPGTLSQDDGEIPHSTHHNQNMFFSLFMAESFRMSDPGLAHFANGELSFKSPTSGQ